MSNKPQIKVLGSGCASCQTTYHLIESVLAEQNIDATLEKVEDLQSIMRYGVMSTPAVVINDVVVHGGGVPKRDDVKSWLASPKPCCDTSAENASGCCDSDANSCCDSNTAENDSGCCSSDKSPCC